MSLCPMSIMYRAFSNPSLLTGPFSPESTLFRFRDRVSIFRQAFHHHHHHQQQQQEQRTSLEHLKGSVPEVDELVNLDVQGVGRHAVAHCRPSHGEVYAVAVV
ncbi:hypothetical protein U9M48_042238 [Paspalum notatum var. saurae]|uniref:Uncharacterized protein n=1 Tax=Paspalum notatum var. saurae TaxID=547442 RepID=A0AAQ3UWK1_PASNO